MVLLCLDTGSKYFSQMKNFKKDDRKLIKKYVFNVVVYV